MLVPIADQLHSWGIARVALRSSTLCLSNSLVKTVGKLRPEQRRLARRTGPEASGLGVRPGVSDPGDGSQSTTPPCLQVRMPFLLVLPAEGSGPLASLKPSSTPTAERFFVECRSASGPR